MGRALHSAWQKITKRQYSFLEVVVLIALSRAGASIIDTSWRLLHG